MTENGRFQTRQSKLKRQTRMMTEQRPRESTGNDLSLTATEPPGTRCRSSWITSLLQKLKVAHVVKNLPAFSGNQTATFMFTSVCYGP